MLRSIGDRQPVASGRSVESPPSLMYGQVAPVSLTYHPTILVQCPKLYSRSASVRHDVQSVSGFFSARIIGD